ncbi:LptA/OstA family protein [Fretibacter rubidus]|uniref:LptA/OstA family protein n=1 Tax=Fretibacter rubidus TaxID=570162 RepID=UPI00352BCFD7
MMIRYLTAFTAVAASLLFPLSAQAQFAANSSAPITGSSDRAEYSPGKIIFSGQVDIRQDNVRILSDEMTVFSGDRNRVVSANEAFEDVNRIEAVGNFFYITPDQEVTGAQGIYERAKDSFTVTGDVILLQGEDNVVTGDRLVYNLSTNQATVTGNCKGRRCGDKGRVNILIKNNDSQQSAPN